LPFCWNDLDKVSPWDRHQKIMMEEAAAAGLHQGIGLGVYGANNEIAGFGIASSQPFAMPDAYPRLVAVLAHQFHMTFLELEKVTATTQPPPHLSPMEREVLKWLSAGKSKWEIAQVVKSAPISEHTVNTHLRRIYQKLGVTGKAQAVTKALLLRLI
jgi:DNA-binding CsgD family transcriptional regulator